MLKFYCTTNYKEEAVIQQHNVMLESCCFQPRLFFLFFPPSLPPPPHVCAILLPFHLPPSTPPFLPIRALMLLPNPATGDASLAFYSQIWEICGFFFISCSDQNLLITLQVTFTNPRNRAIWPFFNCLSSAFFWHCQAFTNCRPGNPATNPSLLISLPLLKSPEHPLSPPWVASCTNRLLCTLPPSSLPRNSHPLSFRGRRKRKEKIL